VVEGVVRVVLGLDRVESPVGLIAVGLSNPAGVVVGIEEVDVDAGGAVWLEGFEESPRPRGLGCSELSGLFGEPRGPLAGNARCARARGRSYGAHRVPRLRREEVAVLAGERSLLHALGARRHGAVSQRVLAHRPARSRSMTPRAPTRAGPRARVVNACSLTVPFRERSRPATRQTPCNLRAL
jgi:hypothetical protein